MDTLTSHETSRGRAVAAAAAAVSYQGPSAAPHTAPQGIPYPFWPWGFGSHTGPTPAELQSLYRLGYPVPFMDTGAGTGRHPGNTFGAAPTPTFADSAMSGVAGTESKLGRRGGMNGTAGMTTAGLPGMTGIGHRSENSVLNGIKSSAEISPPSMTMAGHNGFGAGLSPGVPMGPFGAAARPDHTSAASLLSFAQPAKGYKCKICHEICFSRHELAKHNTTIHKCDPRPYRCEHCGRQFSTSAYLAQHRRIHSGIKPYRCRFCDRKFTQLSHVQQHERIHTGVKPYKCWTCNKAFTQMSNLQSHQRQHMKDKPFHCDHCFMCYDNREELETHVQAKHSGNKYSKVLVCPICGKSYNSETYLNKHLHKHKEAAVAAAATGATSAAMDAATAAAAEVAAAAHFHHGSAASVGPPHAGLPSHAHVCCPSMSSASPAAAVSVTTGQEMKFTPPTGAAFDAFSHTFSYSANAATGHMVSSSAAYMQSPTFGGALPPQTIPSSVGGCTPGPGSGHKSIAGTLNNSNSTPATGNGGGTTSTNAVMKPGGSITPAPTPTCPPLTHGVDSKVGVTTDIIDASRAADQLRGMSHYGSNAGPGHCPTTGGSMAGQQRASAMVGLYSAFMEQHAGAGGRADAGQTGPASAYDLIAPNPFHPFHNLRF